MKHLIIPKAGVVFLSDYYQPENHEKGMVAVDTMSLHYTRDGKKWKEIEEDHL